MISTSLRLIARRSVAHLRLLTAVIAGVVIAVAIMAATFIYFDSLRNLALRHALERQTDASLDVVLQVAAATGQRQSHDALLARVNGIVDSGLSDILQGRHLAIRSATLDFGALDDVSPEEEGVIRRVAFVAIPGIENEVDLVDGAWPDQRQQPIDGEELQEVSPLPEFYAQLQASYGEIAKMGGGKSIALGQDTALMRHLLLLTFGPQWEKDVSRITRGTS